MCLTNFFLISPLEQFEISAFTSNLKIIETFFLENFEFKYYSQILFTTQPIFLISLIFFSIILLIQNFYRIKGLFNLIILIYATTISFNIYSFNDFIIKNINIILPFQIEQFLPEFFDIFEFESPVITIEYFNIISIYINIYSVLFCFIFIYCVIYLIYNQTLSTQNNYILPNFYQILGENLYKISLNLFYSILGKHINLPEFFIKINTIFIFLIISNIQGMIPYMSTLTSALTNTFFIALALFISIITTLLDKKGLAYFLNLFMPSGCPLLLSLLIIPIELISYTFRLVSLSVRLFANMMAGHTLLKVIVGFSWIIVFIGNTFLINLFPILILFILTLLEFGVALIQAYIFTVLSCIYLRDIFAGH